ncbi:DUF2637 domain-containing protein [Actinophytocola sp.]|uniref:DUF2637 domain-containing protein n=1 Tax=Actinophytocola sp. TaxID=1872138 RepID=UPI002ED22210
MTEPMPVLTRPADTTATPQSVPLHSVPDSRGPLWASTSDTADASVTRPATDATDATDATGAVGEVEDLRERAQRVWKESVAAGQPLTGLELGARFDRSERWGRARIADARDSGTGTGGTVPPRRRRAAAAKATRTSGTDAGPSTRHDPNGAEAPAAATDGRDAGAGRREDRPAPDTAAPAVPGVPLPGVPVGLPPGARLVAWAGFLFGTVISVAANVLYAWLPTLAGRAGPPGLAPQIGAAVWPIALVISVEVLSRVPWRPGWAWQLARYGGAGLVAGGAAVISYGHLRGVLAAWGYGSTGAAVGPLVVDGLMTISGFALLAMGNHGKRNTSGNHDGSGGGAGR